MIKRLLFSFIIIAAVMSLTGCHKQKEAPIHQLEDPGSAEDAVTDIQADELGLYAQSAVLLDGTTGRVLYGKNEHVIRPMASTTKILTCILALELANPDDTVTASRLAAGQPKVHLGVYTGETFRLGDLLYSLMLESHNDSAVMIAEHIGGSVEGFAKLMNKKAREIGCSDSYFITPNGLDASETVDGQVMEHATTAVDLGRIMNYCTGQSPKKEEFLKITETQDYYFFDKEEKKSFSCTNHNALLSMMDGLISGKTGFTGGAGYSYVGTLKDGDRMFTIALLGCGWPPHKTYKWSDARKLFAYGKETYEYRNVYEEQKLPDIEVLDAVPPDGDLSKSVKTACEIDTGKEGKELKLLLAPEEKMKVISDVADQVKAPLEKGQCVGTVTYVLDGETVKVYPVCVSESIEKLSFNWCLKKIGSLVLEMPGISL